MNRFDIGVVVVTFVALGLIAIIRGVVVPVVRHRVTQHRLASQAMLAAAPEPGRRNLEVEDEAQ